MKNLLKIMIGAAILFGAACGSGQQNKVQPEGANINWSAEAKAITLKFKASNDLNLDNGQPSSLPICLYQLSETHAFEQLRSQGQPGLDTLAACKKFGGTVAASNMLFLEPGQTLEIFLDRREGVKFVGLVAAYSRLDSDRCIRLYRIPTIELSDGWSSSRWEPDQLIIELNFGSEMKPANF